MPPRSAALSPDGKWLYLTGFHFRPRYPRPHHWLPCVARVPYDGSGELQVFAGSAKVDEFGTEPGKFRVPASLACDTAGRIYVADYKNDRVQVFAPDGKHLLDVAVAKPVELAVHQRTGELYVASWMLLNRWNKDNDVREPTLTRFTPLPKPTVSARYSLALTDHVNKVFNEPQWRISLYLRA